MVKYYARKCVVFWQNLRSWQKIYTPAGLGANFNSANEMIATRNITNKIITTVAMIYKKQQDHTGKEATTKKITMIKTWDSNLLCRCSIDQTEMMILPPTRKTWGESPLIIQTVSGGFIKTLPRQNSDNENKIR